jgi:hypothetical protein
MSSVCAGLDWASRPHYRSHGGKSDASDAYRLRRALTPLADNSRHASAWAAALYAKARGRGCDHPRAIRILSRAWLRVIRLAGIDRKPYDHASHRSLQAMLTTAAG